MHYIVGIDEAGRGPLAGPMTFGIVKMTSSRYALEKKKGGLACGVFDSKQLSPLKREELFRDIKKARDRGQLAYTSVSVSASRIDALGLTRCARIAIAHGLKRIAPQGHSKHHILLDGLLSAPHSYTHQQTIEGGDASQPIIGLASIVAKVTRDAHMRRMAKRYSEYGFDIHKGYGTALHYERIRRHGLSPLHRRRFFKKI
jgi:ribonuclease HII